MEPVSGHDAAGAVGAVRVSEEFARAEPLSMLREHQDRQLRDLPAGAHPALTRERPLTRRASPLAEAMSRACARGDLNPHVRKDTGT